MISGPSGDVSLFVNSKKEKKAPSAPGGAIRDSIPLEKPWIEANPKPYQIEIAYHWPLYVLPSMLNVPGNLTKIGMHANIAKLIMTITLLVNILGIFLERNKKVKFPATALRLINTVKMPDSVKENLSFAMEYSIQAKYRVFIPSV